MILDDIKAALKTALLGTDTTIKLNYYDSTDNIIILWLYGGASSQVQKIETVQIMVKNTNMSTGQTLIKSIYDLLCPIASKEATKYIVLNSNKYIIEANQPPFYLEKDEQSRHTFVFNITAISKRS
ncbi:MAG: hypothetical protein US20_C0005G0006 [Candidatus Pacebacteria bacterium GW2011_GWF1_36_5]|nr:MAG: hypothetical protein US20_C0005G0006 [Candidatus Pacebacteria bacterium GW2011_GWF1_36_5]